MKSNSERTYGARIGNAEKLVTIVQGFGNYQPQKPSLSIDTFKGLILNVKENNNNVAIKKQNYSLAVENRLQVFTKNEYSIKKILSPINATVKVSFGRTAKEATDIAAIIAKIRGANSKIKNTNKTDQVIVSQSYRSYGSQTQFFDDLVTYLTNFNANYLPVNNELSIQKLVTLHSNANDANNKVMDAYSQFFQNNETRIANYNNLSQTAIKIKDSIKAQFGNNSAEYNLVKGLAI